MPLYDYECGKCTHRFELKRHFGEDGDAECPVCSSLSKRLFTPVPILFKGSGFYVTDSKKDKDKSTEQGSTVKKPEVKAEKAAVPDKPSPTPAKS